MCVCMCVCVCLCVYVYICVCLHNNIYTLIFLNKVHTFYKHNSIGLHSFSEKK